MSKEAEHLKLNNISFIIPQISSLEYSNISKTDKALCYVLDRGFIEAESLKSCYLMSTFLCSTLSNKFFKVGSIDKVKLKTQKTVFRQRIYFTDLSLLLSILSNFSIDLIIPKSFRVRISNFVNCNECIPNLTKYLKKKGYTNYSLDSWLTDSCIIQLFILCKLDNVNLSLYKSLSKIYKKGLLVRAPYICGDFSLIKKRSSLVVLPSDIVKNNTYDGILSNTGLSSSYTIKHNNKSVPMFGYTLRNVKHDKGGLLM